MNVLLGYEEYKMKYNYEKIIKSIATLNTRKFGDIGEIIMNKLIPKFTKSENLSYDKNLLNEKIEIKFSRAVSKSEPVTESNVCKVLLEDNSLELISYETDLYKKKWDCNIQQIKPECFDILYYGVCFEEYVYIFKITSKQIIEDMHIKFSNKQHRGNKGEGQFHIKNTNIDYHIKTFLYQKINYKYLWELLDE